MMNRILFLLGLLTLGGLPLTVSGEGRGDEVVVVYNSSMPESKSVADHYAQVRHVPAGQVLGLDLPTVEAISREEYHRRLEEPLAHALETRQLFRYGSNGHLAASKIRYV